MCTLYIGAYTNIYNIILSRAVVLNVASWAYAPEVGNPIFKGVGNPIFKGEGQFYFQTYNKHLHQISPRCLTHL